MKPYFFAYSAACPQEVVHAILNATDVIEDWVAPFPNSAILVSNRDPRELGAIIRRRMKGVWFVVTQIDGQLTDGWLPGDFWQYVNNPAEASLPEPLPQPPLTPPSGIGGLVCSAMGWTKRLAGQGLASSAMERKS